MPIYRKFCQDAPSRGPASDRPGRTDARKGGAKASALREKDPMQRSKAPGGGTQHIAWNENTERQGSTRRSMHRDRLPHMNRSVSAPPGTIRRNVPSGYRMSVRPLIPDVRLDQNGSPTETAVHTPPEEGWYTESLKVEVAEAGWRKMLKSTTRSPPTDQMRRRSVSVIPTSRNWA